MKKLIVIIFGLFVLSVGHASAQQSSNLQGQSSSSVQGNGSSVQNTTTQTPQGTNSLNKLTSGGTNVPFTQSSSTTTNAPVQTSSSSAAQKVLIGFLVFAVFIAGIILWGIVDRKNIDAIDAQQEPSFAPPIPATKKKKPRSKRKKAHR